MKQATKIIRILLIIFTALLILSFFLPMWHTQSNNSYLYEASIYSVAFSIWHILLPLLAICFLFMRFKNSDYISYALYGTSCILAFIFAFMTCGKDSPSLMTSAGLFLYIISAVLIAVTVITLIVLNIIENTKTMEKSVKTNKDDTFVEQMSKLNELKSQGLLTEEEFAEKRAELVRNLQL